MAAIPAWAMVSQHDGKDYEKHETAYLHTRSGGPVCGLRFTAHGNHYQPGQF